VKKEIPKYRLVTTRPVLLSVALDYLRPVLVSSNATDASLPCLDGSLIVLHASEQADHYYVEAQCQFRVDLDGMSFGETFSAFFSLCKALSINIKSIRNGVTMPPSPGALFSEMKWSLAFKRALHNTIHYKDHGPAEAGSVGREKKN
jgi:hypothetical protein